MCETGIAGFKVGRFKRFFFNNVTLCLSSVFSQLLLHIHVIRNSLVCWTLVKVYT